MDTDAFLRNPNLKSRKNNNPISNINESAGASIKTEPRNDLFDAAYYSNPTLMVSNVWLNHNELDDIELDL